MYGVVNCSVLCRSTVDREIFTLKIIRVINFRGSVRSSKFFAVGTRCDATHHALPLRSTQCSNAAAIDSRSFDEEMGGGEWGLNVEREAERCSRR